MGISFPTHRLDVICSGLCPSILIGLAVFLCFNLALEYWKSEIVVRASSNAMRSMPTRGPYSGTEFPAYPDRTSLRKPLGNGTFAEEHLTLNMPLSKRGLGNLKTTLFQPFAAQQCLS